MRPCSKNCAWIQLPASGPCDTPKLRNIDHLCYIFAVFLAVGRVWHTCFRPWCTLKRPMGGDIEKYQTPPLALGIIPS